LVALGYLDSDSIHSFGVTIWNIFFLYLFQRRRYFYFCLESSPLPKALGWCRSFQPRKMAFGWTKSEWDKPKFQVPSQSLQNAVIVTLSCPVKLSICELFWLQEAKNRGDICWQEIVLWRKLWFFLILQSHYHSRKITKAQLIPIFNFFFFGAWIELCICNSYYLWSS